MKTPKQILVVISGRHAQHPALERALTFSKNEDCHIHLFNVMYEPGIEITDFISKEHGKEMKSQYMADRNLYMDSLADELHKKGISCSVSLAWHRELHQAIEEKVDELDPDLVIKRISAEATNLNPFAMPTDRHLLRYCKAPLLLIKHGCWAKKPILAAIDPTAMDAKHTQLNHHILEYSKYLAKFTGAQLHSVNTYEIPGMVPTMGLSWENINFENIKTDTSNAHKDKMESILKEHDLFTRPYHVIEGRADTAIPKLANKIDAQLLVLGTVGRTGVSAAFIGNTAEHVLANMNCDILTLKPSTA
ncbi:universal stress protein [uncultured Paraglaciecola sp.]|uniref:universal stress protein n=1 Tax=uncultured Paraglaciecola sp. TaxID=1765024 RepID=UPI00260DD53D|nr:universal stress protein [uncultured Paraglaciecola sp.]